jgi:hypothetical protein
LHQETLEGDQNFLPRSTAALEVSSQFGDLLLTLTNVVVDRALSLKRHKVFGKLLQDGTFLAQWGEFVGVTFGGVDSD